jgi:predicted ATPase/DNA-binding SARP family transcriptional activator
VLLLGSFEVEFDGVGLDSSRWPRRAGSLLRMLAVAPGRRRLRDEVIDIFWPEAPPETGASNLRSTVQLLRQSLGGHDPSPILSERGWLTLNPEFAWDIDFERFELLVREASGGQTDLSALDAQGGVYRGEPLSEDRYEDWAVPVREAIQRDWQRVCTKAADLSRVEGSLEGAERWLTRQLDSDPLDEQALQSLLEVMAARGQRTEALRAFRRFEERLQTELEVEPAPETFELVERLKRERPAPVEPRRPANQSAGLVDVVPRYPLPAPQPYVGREDEVLQIMAELEGPAESRASLMLIEAEAGMGKTRLLAEVASRSRAIQPVGAITLAGGCYEQEGRLPYGPIRDALADYVRMQPESILQDQLGDLMPELSRVLPELSARLPGSGSGSGQEPAIDSESQRLRLFWAIGQAFSRICEARPLLLILDDLHWADDSTLQLLHFLIRQTVGVSEEVRLLMVGTYRPEEIGPASLLNHLQTESKAGGPFGRRIQMIELSGLKEDQLNVLLNAQVGSTCSRQLLLQLNERTQGNPFFAQQMVAVLRNESALQDGAGGLQLETITGPELPQAVREAITRRFRHLTAERREVLALSAFLGREFSYPSLEMAWAGDEETLLGTLDYALQAALIQETPTGYTFRHPLLHEVLRESTSGARRGVLHRKVALALEESYGQEAGRHASEIAQHFVLAGPAYRDRAIPYFVQAGDTSAQAFAWEESLQYYKRALDLVAETSGAGETGPATLHKRVGDVFMAQAEYRLARAEFAAAREASADEHQVVELWRKEGVALERYGDYQSALAAFDQAETEALKLGDLAEEVVPTIQLSRAEVHLRLGDWRTGDAIASKVLRLVKDANTATSAQAYHVLATAARQQGQLIKAQQLHVRSLEVSQEIGDQHGVAQAWSELANLAALQGDLKRVEQCYREALLVLERIGDQEGIAANWSVLGNAAGVRGSYVEAEEYLRRSLEIRQRIGDPGRIADCWNSLGMVAARRGELIEAEYRLQRGLNEPGQVAEQSRAGTWGTQGLVAFGKGDYREADRLYRKSLEVQKERGDVYGYSMGLVGLGFVFQYRGELDQAEELFEQSLEIQKKLGGRLWAAYATYGLGEVAAERGDLEQAMQLCRAARRMARQLDLQDLESLAALAQSRVFLRVGRSRAPGTLIERAKDMAKEIKATKTSAEAALAMAEFRYLQGDLEEAGEAAQEAIGIAHESLLRREEGIARRVLAKIQKAAGLQQESLDNLRRSRRLLQEIEARLELARTEVALADAIESRDGEEEHVPSEVDPVALRASAAKTFEEIGAALDREQLDRADGTEVGVASGVTER